MANRGTSEDRRYTEHWKQLRPEIPKNGPFEVQTPLYNILFLSIPIAIAFNVALHYVADINPIFYILIGSIIILSLIVIVKVLHQRHKKATVNKLSNKARSTMSNIVQFKNEGIETAKEQHISGQKPSPIMFPIELIQGNCLYLRPFHLGDGVHFPNPYREAFEASGSHIRSFFEDEEMSLEIILARWHSAKKEIFMISDPGPDQNLEPLNPDSSQPKRKSGYLRMGQAKVPDEDWKWVIFSLAAAADQIFVLPGISDGSRWEIETLVNGEWSDPEIVESSSADLASRTIFVMPPALESVNVGAQVYWDAVVHHYEEEAGIVFPKFVEGGALVFLDYSSLEWWGLLKMEGRFDLTWFHIIDNLTAAVNRSDREALEASIACFHDRFMPNIAVFPNFLLTKEYQEEKSYYRRMLAREGQKMLPSIDELGQRKDVDPIRLLWQTKTLHKRVFSLLERAEEMFLVSVEDSQTAKHIWHNILSKIQLAENSLIADKPNTFRSQIASVRGDLKSVIRLID